MTGDLWSWRFRQVRCYARLAADLGLMGYEGVAGAELTRLIVGHGRILGGELLLVSFECCIKKGAHRSTQCSPHHIGDAFKIPTCFDSGDLPFHRDDSKNPLKGLGTTTRKRVLLVQVAAHINAYLGAQSQRGPGFATGTESHVPSTTAPPSPTGKRNHS
jgi:hypothetical protein